MRIQPPSALMSPQWSQSRAGRLTGKQLLRLFGRTLPQWSQPRSGWMTPAYRPLGAKFYMPQWSQPKIG